MQTALDLQLWNEMRDGNKSRICADEYMIKISTLFVDDH